MDLEKAAHTAAKKLLEATFPAAVKVSNSVIKTKAQVSINAENALRSASVTMAKAGMQAALSGQSEKAASRGFDKLKGSGFTKGADSIG